MLEECNLFIVNDVSLLEIDFIINQMIFISVIGKQQTISINSSNLPPVNQDMFVHIYEITISA